MSGSSELGNNSTCFSNCLIEMLTNRNMKSVPSTSVTGGHLELSSCLGAQWGKILEKTGLGLSERWDTARGRVTYSFIWSPAFKSSKGSFHNKVEC